MNAIVDDTLLDSPTSPCPCVVPGSIPVGGRTISTVDLDLTLACNLRCDYCFKEKASVSMPLSTAREAVLWLILASEDVNRVRVNMIGGEPLLAFGLIKELVPFAKRRAWQHAKEVHFSITTNGTIMTDEILEFWQHWGIGFHTSIDGCPSVQDKHRRCANGAGSSELLKKNLPRILALRPWTTARGTVVPDTVRELTESFEYIRSLGYRDIALVPGNNPAWDDDAIEELTQQLTAIMHKMFDLFRAGERVRLKFFDEGAKALARPSEVASGIQCGAGKGMVLIDVHGDIWPCHRWSKASESPWKLGSIFRDGRNESVRERIMRGGMSMQSTLCKDCPAGFVCTGGCPAENLEETGDPFVRHPQACKITRAMAAIVREFHDTLRDESNTTFLETYYSQD